MITTRIIIIILPKSKKNMKIEKLENTFISAKLIYIYFFIHVYFHYHEAKWKIFHQCHLFTRSGKTLMICITSRNCKVSFYFYEVEKMKQFCVFIYIFDFISMKCKILHQHLLFARITNNYLIFFVALYFTNAFYFHEMEKSFNDLSCIHIVKTTREGN